MSKLRILFAGTPLFAASALKKLLDDPSIEVLAVLTQPDRPAGRGLSIQQSPVKKLALEHFLEVLQPESLKSENAQQALASYHADLMVVAAYGLILPAKVLGLFPQGCINIHASLLPKWRGAAPIHRAIWSGDKETGICIMSMDEGLDTGNIYKSYKISIDPQDTTGTLHDKLAELGAYGIVDVLHSLPKINPMQQIGEATYAHKIKKEEARISWLHHASYIERQIKALNPSPTAWTVLGAKRLKIWEACTVDFEPNMEQHTPGLLFKLDEKFYICCGERTHIQLIDVQLSGSKRLSANSFFTSNPQWVGSIL
jgi:methionyl-tRNA formyltransferase